MKKILTTLLLILMIILIYTIIFPKKSYVETLLDKELTPQIEETFNKNINTMKIAANEYFKESESKTVTLQELIEKKVITELKDSNNETCDNKSYVEKTNAKTTIYLKCNDKEETINIENKTKENKMLCLYEYKKEKEELSDWSEWTEKEIKEDNNTVVET